MCPKHEHMENQRRRLERRKTKLRRAQRVAQSVPIEQEIADLLPEPALEEEPVPKIKRTPPHVPARISDEIKVEIAHHYADSRIPIKWIQRQFSVGAPTMFAIVDELGVPRRGAGSGSGREMGGQFMPDPSGQYKFAWVPSVEPAVPGAPVALPSGDGVIDAEDEANNRLVMDRIPEPARHALEHMITEPDRSQVPPRLAPRPEPVAPTPAVERRAQSKPPVPAWQEQEHWLITVKGLISVSATSLEDAIATIKHEHPNLIITKVELQDS